MRIIYKKETTTDGRILLHYYETDYHLTSSSINGVIEIKEKTFNENI